MPTLPRRHAPQLLGIDGRHGGARLPPLTAQRCAPACTQCGGGPFAMRCDADADADGRASSECVAPRVKPGAMAAADARAGSSALREGQRTTGALLEVDEAEGWPDAACRALAHDADHERGR